MNGQGGTKIKTSVIIPVYNVEEYLEECINSVLAQTQKEIEIILVDDGSTDKSSEIIDKYETKYTCVRGIHQNNQKLGAARNTGFRIANGEYVYFLDADDYIDSRLLEECYYKCEHDNLDFVMFDARAFSDEDGNEKRKIDGVYDRSNVKIEDKIYSGVEFWKKFYDKNGVYPNAVLVYANRDFLVNNSLYFEEGVFYEDNDWSLRAYCVADRIAYLPQKYYNRRYRKGSIMTSEYSDIHLRSCFVLCSKLYNMMALAGDSYKSNMICQLLEKMLGFTWAIIQVFNFEKYENLVEVFFSAIYDLFNEMFEYMREEKEKITFLILRMADKLGKIAQTLNHSEIEDKILEIHDKTYTILKEILLGYPLQQKIKIGIYGTGQVADNFLCLYQHYVGTICADVFFIDSYKTSGEMYNGAPLYNIVEVNKLMPGVIIIASTKYGEEMERNVREYLGQNIEVQFVPQMLISTVKHLMFE